MIVLIQRVTCAQIRVAQHCIAQIAAGLLAFVAIERGDQSTDLQRMLRRLLGYRVFPDIEGKMNLNITQVNGELLLVPQFTLAADTVKGMRPSFSSAAEPVCGKRMFDEFVNLAQGAYQPVRTGQFGADMQVHLINDGPVTFLLRTGKVPM